jgi:hypothetical protein
MGLGFEKIDISPDDNSNNFKLNMPQTQSCSNEKCKRNMSKFKRLRTYFGACVQADQRRIRTDC